MRAASLLVSIATVAALLTLLLWPVNCYMDNHLDHRGPRGDLRESAHARRANMPRPPGLPPTEALPPHPSGFTHRVARGRGGRHCRAEIWLDGTWQECGPWHVRESDARADAEQNARWWRRAHPGLVTAVDPVVAGPAGQPVERPAGRPAN